MTRPGVNKIIEAISIIVFLTLYLRHGFALVGLGDGPVTLLTMVPAAVLGYLASDIASGIAHWFCDTFFEEDTPVIGRLFIAPFREHHRDPMALTRHSFLELVGNSSLGLVPFLILPPSRSVAFETFLLVFSAGLLLTNLFHRWSHVETPGRWVTFLQKSWLILPPHHHRVHHRDNHSRNYCVTTGWSNAALEACQFYRIAEWCLFFPRAKRTKEL